MAKTLVIGGSGYTGVSLVSRLVARGDDVRVLTRGSSKTVELKRLECECVAGDIRDPAAVRSAMKGCDRVFHLAAVVDYWRNSRETVYSINAEGTRVVMQACLESAVDVAIHTSSVSAIGMPGAGEIANEQTPFDARSQRMAYPDSKRIAEQHVQGAVQQGLHAVIVNPAQIIGPGDHGLYNGSVLQDLQRGYIRAVPSGGMCLVDVRAVVDGLLAAAARGRAGERYILGGNNLSYQEICAIAADVLGQRVPDRIIPDWVLPPFGLAVDSINRLTGRHTTICGDHIRLAADHLYYDSRKAVDELDYPIRPFREALIKACEWYIARGFLTA